MSERKGVGEEGDGDGKGTVKATWARGKQTRGGTELQGEQEKFSHHGRLYMEHRDHSCRDVFFVRTTNVCMEKEKMSGDGELT